MSMGTFAGYDDLQKRSNAGASNKKNNSIPERFRRRIEENNKRRAAAEAAAREAELEQQRINAQAQRDKRLQKYEQANTGQRAAYAADAALSQFGYNSKLEDQQQKGQLRRDEFKNRFEAAQARQQALEQEMRDRRQFGFSQEENASQFRNQLQRDALQHGYTQERDRFQTDAQRERDAAQFGYTTLRDDQQFGQQLERDKLLNEFSAQGDQRQQQFTLRRDELQNQFSTQADERQQAYTQQNMYQREAAEISARWQEQVAQAKNAGYDYSPQQRKEMQDMETSFRKNVLNGPWPEDVKMRASVEYQKKLSAFVPNERVMTQEQEVAQAFYKDPELGILKRKRTAQGYDWEAFDTGAGQQQSQQAQMQQKQAEQQQKQMEQKQQQMQKALFEREDKFSDIVNELSMQSDADGNLIYGKRDAKGNVIGVDRQAVIKEAMRRFDPYEKHYRDVYGLPPLGPYQAEADRIRAQTEKVSGSSAVGWESGPQQGQSTGAMANQPFPVISSKAPLPKQVSDQLRTIPGGDQLQKLREKHKGNAIVDQTVREAVDIVIKAMMTGDTSDPDFAEAQGILQKAGVQIGQ